MIVYLISLVRLQLEFLARFATLSTMTNIVVLDALPLDPGDLDWSRLTSVADVVRHDGTAPSLTAERIATADIVLTNKVRLPREVVLGAPDLRLICVLATGYDVVDVAAARERNIPVCNVPAYSANFTAQTAVALLLEIAQRTGAHSDLVHQGEWSRSTAFSFWRFPLVELAGKTAVIVGMGNIGQRVAAILSALGMNVIAAELPGRSSAASSSEWKRQPIDEAVQIADVISLHCPLTPVTRGLVNEQLISKMKSAVLIVNAARGPIVVESDLAEALNDGSIAGFAADVLSTEPPDPANPLLTSANTIITPHLAWASPEARRKLLGVTIDNVLAFLSGNPQNVVN